MNVVNVLVSAVRDGAPDALRDDTRDTDDGSSGAAPADTTPPVIEHESVRPSEGQILTLLDASDGRMWQQDVIAETGFSAATVSRHLSKLEDDGRIVRLRKGRKKVVVDPELVPPALSEER